MPPVPPEDGRAQPHLGRARANSGRRPPPTPGVGAGACQPQRVIDASPSRLAASLTARARPLTTIPQHARETIANASPRARLASLKAAIDPARRRPPSSRVRVGPDRRGLPARRLIEVLVAPPLAAQPPLHATLPPRPALRADSRPSPSLLAYPTRGGLVMTSTGAQLPRPRISDCLRRLDERGGGELPSPESLSKPAHRHRIVLACRSANDTPRGRLAWVSQFRAICTPHPASSRAVDRARSPLPTATSRARSSTEARAVPPIDTPPLPRQLAARLPRASIAEHRHED